MTNNNYDETRKDPAVSALMTGVQAALYFPERRLGEGIVAIRTIVDPTLEERFERRPEVK